MLRVILEIAYFMKYALFCSFHEMRSKIAHFMKQLNLLPISWNEQNFVAHFMKYAIENLRVKRLNASLLISWNGQFALLQVSLLLIVWIYRCGCLEVCSLAIRVLRNVHRVLLWTFFHSFVSALRGSSSNNYVYPRVEHRTWLWRILKVLHLQLLC